jgi:hypothetical protein
MSPEFKQGTMDGILGLAFSKLNTIHVGGVPVPQPTPVENMITQEDIPKDCELFTSAMYSHRDEGKKSFYTFGWIDQDLLTECGGEITWAKIDTSEGFWKFKSERSSVDGENILSPGNTAIADTGTTLALLRDDVCEKLYSKITGAVYSEKYQGWTIPKDTKLEDLPDFSISVGDNMFVIQKEDLLFTEADDEVWYGGVQSRGDNPFDILGDTFLKSIYAVSFSQLAVFLSSSCTDCDATRFGIRATNALVPSPRSRRLRTLSGGLRRLTKPSRRMRRAAGPAPGTTPNPSRAAPAPGTARQRNLHRKMAPLKRQR